MADGPIRADARERMGRAERERLRRRLAESTSWDRIVEVAQLLEACRALSAAGAHIHGVADGQRLRQRDADEHRRYQRVLAELLRRDP